MLRYAYFIFGLTTLCACSSITSNDTRRAACNELKSQMVFNGATSITRQSEIEQTETPVDQRTYFANNCDQL